MSNEEIPSKLWELKNDAVRSIQNNAISNDYHNQYKTSWEWLGRELEGIGKEMQELAKQFIQPKED